MALSLSRKTSIEFRTERVNLVDAEGQIAESSDQRAVHGLLPNQC